MSFSRPIHWYHSHADPIWTDDTFKNAIAKAKTVKFFSHLRQNGRISFYL